MNDYRSTFLSDAVFETPKFQPQSAWAENIPFIFWLVSQLKPKRFVELGTQTGISYFAVCQAVISQDLDCECISVHPSGSDGDNSLKSNANFQSIKPYNEEKYSAFSKVLRVQFESFIAQVDDGSVDLLQIDARHAFEDIETLFKSWQSKLSDRAVVLFQGITASDAVSGIGTLWNELENTYPSFKFNHGQGLGLVAIGENIVPSLQAVVSGNEGVSGKIVRSFFNSLGHNLADPGSAGRPQEAAHQMSDERARMRQSSEVVVNHNALEVVKLTNEREVLAAKLRSANIDLAKARNRPIRLLIDKIAYKTLKSLLKVSSNLPQRATRRFKESANKRDPRRSIRIAGYNAFKSKSMPKTAMVLYGSSRKYDPSKPTVMIVDHDTSGAETSLIILNIAQELSKKYNVVSMFLRAGLLSGRLSDASVATVEFSRHALSLDDIQSAVKELQQQFEFEYAITNAAVSRYVLMALQDANIPSTSLMHDFASGLLPVTTVPEVFSNSDSIVFSSEETLRDAISDALSHAGLGRPSNASVLNPGRFALSDDDLTKEELTEEIAWLDSVLGQRSADGDTFVVVGAGDVELRKGLDLFINVAHRAVNGQADVNFRFIWFGTGYDPIRDREQSFLIADQILRAGLRGHLKIVRPTSEMEYALEKADALLLSSRLDSFPSVAIDAVLKRTPVLCFDRTTGFANFLKESGVGETCVASYLDTVDMAQKLTTLAENHELQDDVVNKALAAGSESFDLSKYVEKLDAIASRTIPARQQAKEDAEFLKKGTDFRSDFFWHKEPQADLDQQIEEYLTSSRSGIVARKPMPGFHPSIYAEKMGSRTGTDPFVEFLKAGKPEGPWLFPVIDESSDIDLPAAASCSAALHMHVFYEQELTEILHRLSLNSARPDLFVSTSANKLDAVDEALSKYQGKVAKIEAVPNRGRDIGPFLTAFGKNLTAGYDFIGHLHTKRSHHVANSKAVEAWSTFLLENVIGGERGGAMLDRILTRMACDPEVGIVYPDEPNILGWKENEGAARGIAERLQIDQLPMQFNFPAGSMFWMRKTVLDRFVSLNLGWSDFPSEPLPHHDGTILHAIERLFGVVPKTMNMKTVLTNVRGVTR